MKLWFMVLRSHCTSMNVQVLIIYHIFYSLQILVILNLGCLNLAALSPFKHKGFLNQFMSWSAEKA